MVYGDEFSLPHEIAVFIGSQAVVRVFDPAVLPNDVSSLVNPASAGTN